MTNIRIQSANQLAQDMSNAHSIITQAKQTYDKGVLTTIENKFNDLYVDFTKEVIKSNDFDNYDQIAQKYQSQMEAYLDEIKAPSSVRKEVSNSFLPQVKTKMKDYSQTAKIKGYYNDASVRWENYITKIGADPNLTYKQKEEKLKQYYSTNSVADIPKSIVPNVTSVEDAMEDMLGSCVVQYVDKMYSSGSYKGKSTTELTSMAVNALNDELPEEKKLDASQEAQVWKIANSQVAYQESRKQAEAENKQAELDLWATTTTTEGTLPTASEILSRARELGAYNEDGTLSKYWVSYLAGYEDTFKAQIAYDQQVAQMEEQAKIEASQNQTINALTGGDWMGLIAGFSKQFGFIPPTQDIETSQDSQANGSTQTTQNSQDSQNTYNFLSSSTSTPVSSASTGTSKPISTTIQTSTQNAESQAENATGQIPEAPTIEIGGQEIAITDISQIKSEHKQLEFSDGRILETDYYGLASQMASLLEITDKKSPQFYKIVQQANLIGSYVEEQLKAISDAKDKEFRANVLKGIFDVNTISNAMILASSPDAQLLESNGKEYSQLEFSYDGLSGDKTYSFEGKPSLSTKYDPVVQWAAHLLGVEDKNSEAYRSIVMGINMWAEAGIFVDPYTTAEAQFDRAKRLSDKDIFKAVDELNSKSAFYTSRPSVHRANTPMISADGEQLEEGDTYYSDNYSLGMFIDDKGNISRDVIADSPKSYGTYNGMEVTSKWSPIVDKILAQNGIEDMAAVAMVVSRVNYMGEVANAFAYGERDYQISILQAARSNPSMTAEEYNIMYNTMFAQGHLKTERGDDKYCEGLGLGVMDTSFDRLPTETQTSLNAQLERTLKEVMYGSDEKTNVNSTTIGKTNEWEDVLALGKEALRAKYNELADPANGNGNEFLAKKDEIIREVATMVYDKAMHKTVQSAMKQVKGWLNYHEGFSANTDISQFMQGIYDPGWHGTEYKNYSLYLDPYALAASENVLNTFWNQRTIKTDGIGSDFKWDDFRDQVTAQMNLGVKKYDDLSDRDKAIVNTCLLKVEYEHDFKETTSTRFQLDNSCYMTISKRGPCMVDPNNGRLYICCGDSKTSNVYNVYNLDENALKTIDDAYKKGEVLTGSFLDSLPSEFNGPQNYKTIMKHLKMPGKKGMAWGVPVDEYGDISSNPTDDFLYR